MLSSNRGLKLIFNLRINKGFSHLHTQSYMLLSVFGASKLRYLLTFKGRTRLVLYLPRRPWNLPRNGPACPSQLKSSLPFTTNHQSKTENVCKTAVDIQKMHPPSSNKSYFFTMSHLLLIDVCTWHVCLTSLFCLTWFPVLHSWLVRMTWRPELSPNQATGINDLTCITCFHHWSVPLVVILSSSHSTV